MTLGVVAERAPLLAGDLEEGTVPMANRRGPIEGSTGKEGVTGVFFST